MLGFQLVFLASIGTLVFRLTGKFIEGQLLQAPVQEWTECRWGAGFKSSKLPPE
jgi:hypothetical protein